MDDAFQFFYDSQGNVIALLLRAEYSCKGIKFFTKDEDYQQVGFMEHPAGYKIAPHYHNKVVRTVDYTCETLVMRKGLMEVRLYENQRPLHIFNMKAGDIITIFAGGGMALI